MSTDNGSDGGESHVSISRGMEMVAIDDDEGKYDWNSMDLTPAAQKLISINGDTIHQNSGLHLHVSVDNDEEWQKICKILCWYNHLMHKPFGGAVRKSESNVY